MKIKKAFNVFVEVTIDESDNFQAIARNPQGQPFTICNTPAELQALFLELSESGPATTEDK